VTDKNGTPEGGACENAALADSDMTAANKNFTNVPARYLRLQTLISIHGGTKPIIRVRDLDGNNVS